MQEPIQSQGQTGLIGFYCKEDLRDFKVKGRSSEVGNFIHFVGLPRAQETCERPAANLFTVKGDYSLCFPAQDLQGNCWFPNTSILVGK